METTWIEMTPRYKNIYSILLAEKALEYVNYKEQYRYALDVIEQCWKWIKTKDIPADDLYHLLDNEDNGLTIFQESEENEIRIHAWDCVIDAVAYITRNAYEHESAKYYPEPIELVSDETLKHLTDSLLNCDKDNIHYIDEVYHKCLAKEKIENLKNEL